MNVFTIIKAHVIKKTASDLPFDCSMDFLKNARKVVTPIRKTISLDLSLDKYFNQIDSISSELISVIGLTTGNNSSSRNVSSLFIRSKALLQRLYQIGICCPY